MLDDAAFWVFGFPLPAGPAAFPGADDFDEADELVTIGFERRGDDWPSLGSLFSSAAPGE